MCMAFRLGRVCIRSFNSVSRINLFPHKFPGAFVDESDGVLPGADDSFRRMFAVLEFEFLFHLCICTGLFFLL